MSSRRKLDRPGASSDPENHGSSSGNDGQLHLDPSKGSGKAAPLQSSGSSSACVSVGSAPTPETRAKDSAVSPPTSPETHEHRQRQRTPFIDENPSHDPAIPLTDITKDGTGIGDGQRTDEGSRSGPHRPEVPPHVKEPCPSPPNTRPSSIGSSLLLGVGSAFASHNPQPYAPLDSLDDEDNP